MENLQILPIFSLFSSKNIENWTNFVEFKQISALFYQIKRKELGDLVEDLDEISQNFAFLSYLKTYRTLDYFYVIRKNNKFIGVLSFDITTADLYFKQGKYLIFTQTGVISEEMVDFWFLMKQFKEKIKQIMEIEKPNFFVSYLKNVKHNERLLDWFLKTYNLKVSLKYNHTFVR